MKEINDELLSSLVYKSPVITTPLKDNIEILYADYTASGRPSPLVEQYLVEQVLPYYANTHSNAYCGTLMKNKIQKAKEYIKKAI